MNIVITGGAGFLGQRLAKTLLTQHSDKIEELVLVDVIKPTAPNNDSRVRCLEMDCKKSRRFRCNYYRKNDRYFPFSCNRE